MVEIISAQVEKILYKGKISLPTTDYRLPLSERSWYVYILQCNDNSLYTGVTNDLIKRMKTHESGKGSKYVKAKGFRQLLRFKKCENKIRAQQFEYQIKQLPKSEKLSWFIQNK